MPLTAEELLNASHDSPYSHYKSGDHKSLGSEYTRAANAISKLLRRTEKLMPSAEAKTLNQAMRLIAEQGNAHKVAAKRLAAKENAFEKRWKDTISLLKQTFGKLDTPADLIAYLAMTGYSYSLNQYKDNPVSLKLCYLISDRDAEIQSSAYRLAKQSGDLQTLCADLFKTYQAKRDTALQPYLGLAQHLAAFSE